MTYKLMYKWTPKWMLGALILSIIIASFDGVYFASLIAGIASFNQDASLSDLGWFAVSFIGARLFIFGGMQAGWTIRSLIIKHLNIRLKENYIKQFLKSDKRDENISDNLSVITNDFELIEENFFSPLLETLNYIATVLASIIYILSIDFWLGWLFISLSCISFIPSLIFSNRLNDETLVLSKKNQSYLSAITDIFHNKHAIKTYGVEISLLDKMAMSLESRESAQYRLNVLQTFISLSASALSFIGGFTPILVGLYFFISDQYNLSLLVAMYLASDRIAYPVRIISYYLGQINSTKDLRRNIKIEENFSDRGSKRKETQKIQTIEVIDLTYGIKDKVLFEGYHQTFNQGKKYLLVGPSGRGKSTLLKLIQGWLLPQSGQIHFKTKQDNIIATEMLERQSVAYISQNPMIFHDSLRFNLIFSDNKKRDLEIIAILKQLNLWDELGEECLDLLLESEGKNLSGGQIQRIEIARALLSNPQVMLIDEMTSALDDENAKIVRQYIWQLPITIIEVAHHYDQEMVKRYDLKIIEL